MSSFSNNNAKLDHLNERLHRASGIRNKAKKLEVMAKIQREKKLLSEDNRKKRKREREELGDKAPPKQVPKTIDSMRKFDETTVEENDEEIMADEEDDEFSEWEEETENDDSNVAKPVEPVREVAPPQVADSAEDPDIVVVAQSAEPEDAAAPAEAIAKDEVEQRADESDDAFFEP